MRNIKKYQANYLNSIMLHASGYAAVFMFSMSWANMVAFPLIIPEVFAVGYLAGMFALHMVLSQHKNKVSHTAIALMVGLTAWTGVAIGSMMALSPMLLGYFSFSIYMSILTTAGLVYFRDTLIPKNLTDFVQQSAVVIATSAIVWFIAGIVMQASVPAMTIGFAALSSYLSVMFIMTNIRLALLEAKVSHEPPHAASVAFSVFMNTVSLALDIFNIILSLHESGQDKRHKITSRKANMWTPLFRLITILIDLFRVFAVNKMLDDLDELVVIERGPRGSSVKRYQGQPVDAQYLGDCDTGYSTSDQQPVYDQHGNQIGGNRSQHADQQERFYCN